MESSEGWFYQRRVPEADELVMVKIAKVDDSGVLCHLLEYNQIEAHLALVEVSKKRFRSIRQIFSVGQVKVLQVLRCEGSYVGLTRRHLNSEQEEEGVDKYEKGKHTLSIFRQLAEKTGVPFDQLCETVLWPLYNESTEHPYYRLLNSEEISGIPEELKEPLKKIVEKRAPPKEHKVESIFELTCFTCEGIDSIKETLKKTRAQYPQIGINYVSAPEYRLTVSDRNLSSALDLLKNALELIKEEIAKLGGGYKTKIQPHEMGEA